MVAAILLLAGCVQIEEGGGFSDMPLTFRTYTPRATKSDPGVVSGNALPNNSYFGVFAWYQPGTVGSHTGTWSELASKNWTPNFMFNQQVYFADDTYSYAPLRYWPANEENTISFWAYWPYELYAANNSGVLKLYQDNACTQDYTSSSSNGLPVVKYTVSNNQAEQYDLLFDSFVSQDMTWDNCSESSSNTDGVVPLTFRHALSQIVFNVSVSNEVSAAGGEATIKAVSLTGVNTVGTCLNPAASLDASYWTSVGTPQTTSFTLGANQQDAAFILMPQALAEDGNTGHSVVSLTLTFDISFPAADDPSARVTYANNEMTAPVWTSTYGTTSWLPGRKYVYNILAGLTEIEFSEVFTELWTNGDDIVL